MLSEIGAATHDGEVFREAFAFHYRTLALDKAALTKDSQNVSLRRNFAGELVMSAYAKVLANQQLSEAETQCDEGLKVDEALAAADPSNTEAQQDLSFAYYVSARIRQLQGYTADAAVNYRKSLSILEPLTAAHPENVETAYDLRRSQDGLAEATSQVTHN